MSARALSAKRIVAMANLPKVSHSGVLNPFFGASHSRASRNAISISKGTQVHVYEICGDNLSHIHLGRFNSATKASAALASLGIMISRPSILKYLSNGTIFITNERQVYFKSK